MKEVHGIKICIPYLTALALTVSLFGHFCPTFSCKLLKMNLRVLVLCVCVCTIIIHVCVK